MAEIEDQIRAWADAAAPPVGGDPLVIEDLPIGGGGEHRARWLAAAAVVAVLMAGAAVVWAVVGAGDGEAVRSGSIPPPTTASSTAPDGGPTAPAVRYRLLHDERNSPSPAYTLVSAATEDQLQRLWDTVPDAGAVPTVDFDREVVVAMTLPGSCPRRLTGMERAAFQLVAPRFGEPTRSCPADGPQRTIVAIDRASAGDRFWFRLSAADLGLGTVAPDASILVDRARPQQVLVDVALDRSTVPVGGEVIGTVTVSNASGQPIPVGFCGREFGISLANGRARQSYASTMCLQQEDVPTGTSTYPVSVPTSYLGCVTSQPGLGVLPCRPDGTPPDLPAGEYQITIHQPSGLDAAPPDPPATVTLTAR